MIPDSITEYQVLFSQSPESLEEANTKLCELQVIFRNPFNPLNIIKQTLYCDLKASSYNTETGTIKLYFPVPTDKVVYFSLGNSVIKLFVKSDSICWSKKQSFRSFFTNSQQETRNFYSLNRKLTGKLKKLSNEDLINLLPESAKSSLFILDHLANKRGHRASNTLEKIGKLMRILIEINTK